MKSDYEDNMLDNAVDYTYQKYVRKEMGERRNAHSEIDVKLRCEMERLARAELPPFVDWANMEVFKKYNFANGMGVAPASITTEICRRIAASLGVPPSKLTTEMCMRTEMR
jgi:hypothetical protein